MDANTVDAVRVGTFDRYRDARDVVTALAERGDAPDVDIVGRDLRYIERPTDRPSLATAVALGGGLGLLSGAVVGLVFGALTWLDPQRSALTLTAWGALVGLAVGAAVGAVFATVRGRAWSASGARVEASRFEIVSDSPESAQRARHTLLRVREGSSSPSV